ncbi:hypothetical protein [Nocardioides aequoreus]|uniref:hypothetical protein n=1 Tax=Nocardioides aequoreus TaxID=397278 RepID=UPI0012F6D8E3|nr:hypothetical protein [Nocardioides aequoreus]
MPPMPTPATTSPRAARLGATGLGAIAAGATVVLVAVGFVWSAPRADVPLPGPDATPEQVVRTYVEAVNGRDFETANQIDVRPGTELHRWSRPPKTRILELGETTLDGGRAYVPFTADVDGGDGTVADGAWGYYLQRGHDGSWHIIDAGVA